MIKAVDDKLLDWTEVKDIITSAVGDLATIGDEAEKEKGEEKDED